MWSNTLWIEIKNSLFYKCNKPNLTICKSDHGLVRSPHTTGHCKSHLWLDHKLYFLSAASFTRQFSSSLLGLASRSFFCRASNYKPIEIIKIFEEIDNCIIDFSQQPKLSRFFTIKICRSFTVSWMNDWDTAAVTPATGATPSWSSCSCILCHEGGCRDGVLHVDHDHQHHPARGPGPEYDDSIVIVM